MDVRKFRGLQIAKAGRIKKLKNSWLVPSESRNDYYSVKLVGDKQVCNCPDFELRQHKCKHIWSEFPELLLYFEMTAAIMSASFLKFLDEYIKS